VFQPGIPGELVREYPEVRAAIPVADTPPAALPAMRVLFPEIEQIALRTASCIRRNSQSTTRDVSRRFSVDKKMNVPG
jgi:hypothetical protein